MLLLPAAPIMYVKCSVISLSRNVYDGMLTSEIHVKCIMEVLSYRTMVHFIKECNSKIIWISFVWVDFFLNLKLSSFIGETFQDMKKDEEKERWVRTRKGSCSNNRREIGIVSLFIFIQCSV